jgi:hypothetical protein
MLGNMLEAATLKLGMPIRVGLPLQKMSNNIYKFFAI